MLRKNRTPRGTASISDKIVEPVHVKPDTDSNRALSKCAHAIEPVIKKGKAPAIETASQLHATEARATGVSARADTEEEPNMRAPMDKVRKAETRRPKAPPPPSAKATPEEANIPNEMATNAEPETLKGVPLIFFIELPFFYGQMIFALTS
jgi:hypothetical protein